MLPVHPVPVCGVALKPSRRSRWRMRAWMAVALAALLPTRAPGADADEALARLEAERQRRIAEAERFVRIQASREPGANVHLTLVRGADDDDLLLRLSRDGGEWRSALGAVPAWRFLTHLFPSAFADVDEGYESDTFALPVEAEGLVWHPGDGRLEGDLTVGFRLESVRRERVPDGLGPHLSSDGQWSYLDRFAHVPENTPRAQRYRIDAWPLPGVNELRLVFDNGIQGRPIRIHTRVPLGPGDRPRVTTLGWSRLKHLADLSGLRLADGRLDGTVVVHFSPEPPREGPPEFEVLRMTYEIEARIEAGVIGGHYRARLDWVEDPDRPGEDAGRGPRVWDGPETYQGRVHGRLLDALEGRWKGAGDLDAGEGRLSGGFARRPDSIRDRLPDPPSGASDGPNAPMSCTARSGR